MEHKVSIEAWIATALLHRSHPERPDFSVYEIRKQAEQEFGAVRPGVYQHIVNHGVAQAKPAPARLRLFTQTGHGRRRLFRPGDPENPARKAGKTHPTADELPQKYRDLIEWYEHSYLKSAARGVSGESDGGGSSPAIYLQFVGLIPAYDLEIMRKTIETDCERIDEIPQSGGS